MATKPAGNPPIWAQTTNYPAGADPWSTQLTKVTAPTATGLGFTPETGIVAEYANSELNTLSTWANWLSFGSPLATIDSHVIETTVTGSTAVAGIQLGGTAASFVGLLVNSNAGSPAVAASIINTTGGISLVCISDGRGIVATVNTNDGDAITGTGFGTGSGIVGTGGATDGAGVDGTGDGAGPGVRGTGGDTGAGGVFEGGATAGNGIVGTAVASFFGVEGNGSASSPAGGGVIGNAGRNDQVGIAGLAFIPGADPLIQSSSAVLGISDSGTAVFGKAVAGYGVWAQADKTGPTRSALHIEPQDTDPTTQLEGDVFYHSGEDQLKGRINGTTMGLWATGHGYAYLYGENAAQVDEAGTNFVSVVTQLFALTYRPKENNAVMTATVCFEFGSDTAGTSFQWRLRDITAGADVIASRLEEVHNAGAVANDRYLTAKASYTIPLAGDRTFALQIRSVDGFAISRIRRASIEFTGSHG